MTTAIYARISDDRADGAGVDRQLADGRAFCKRKGWAVSAAHEYVDNSISASKSGKVRPRYQAMLAAVKAGEITQIVVWMIDRLYRQPRELEDLIELAEAGRVEVYSTQSGEGIDLSSADGATMARVIVAFASGESRKISVRVKRQQTDRRKAGLHHGSSRPFGYNRVGGKLVPKPDEVAIITNAMRSVLGGKSLANIADEWSHMKLPHPQHLREHPTVHVYPWSAVSVGTILRSPRNIGRMADREGEWSAIVPTELFEACAATIAQRRTRGTSPSGQRGMLTGLMHCGECDARMHRGRNAHTVYYHCPSTACGKVGIKAEFVEELTLATMRERLKGQHFKLDTGRPTKESQRLRTIGAHLSRIDRRVEELAVTFANATGVNARVLRRTGEILDTEQRALLAERDALLAVSPLRIHGDVNALMQDWDTLTADQQHAIIEAVLTRITVAHVGRGKWPVETMRKRVTFGA